MIARPDRPIRSVVFDFGGVLLRWNPEHILRQLYAEERDRRALRSAVFAHPDWIEFDRGTLTETGAAERFAARTGRPVEEMKNLLAYVRSSLTPIEESFAIVNSLAARGFPLYALSNMPASTFEHLQVRYDCWRAFQGIVISGQIGMVKPDSEIFRYICGRYGLDPAETLFIDDHPANIESGARFGFRTLQFSNPQQCAAELDAVLGDAHAAPGQRLTPHGAPG